MSRAHSYSHGRAHSPSFQSLHLRHSSFSNPSLALLTSQLIPQPFRCFTYVTAHSPTLLSLSYVTGFSLTTPGEPPMPSRQSSFFKLSVTSPTSQLILQPFPRFTYVTAHFPTLPLLHLCHSSFSNPSFASPTSQDFTYITWRAAHVTVQKMIKPMFIDMAIKVVSEYAFVVFSK